MSDDQPIDYEAIRRRFPWAGLVSTGAHDLSARCREIMAEARRDREIVEPRSLGALGRRFADRFG
ncbi:hypothetical protein [Amycolatopsis sp. GM8]|uniref:hypothetical protein n=1 Tax=Amycolatopsis sp. GM8 TaxID=2896530 RepID=UPI001F3A8B82|nr:hypothetical protein [Amycolatopsis sp. GM8]